jgi:nicotinate-nucleotide adenylyltransferase
MQKIGLYFGSFNPVHIGHLLVATHIKEAAKLDEVWLVVSPQNPFKINTYLINAAHRLQMVKLATENVNYFKVSDIEFQLPKPSYTHQTLKELSKIYTGIEFQVIIGEDNVAQLHQWKEIDWIFNNFQIIVYNRTIEDKNHKYSINQLKYYNLPMFDISSTEIRNRIAHNQSIQYFVTENVKQYIEFHNLYR